MKYTRLLVVASVILMVVAAFFIGRNAGKTSAKKVELKKFTQLKVVKKKQPAVNQRPAKSIAKVAIVIDDFGNNTSNLEALYSIKEPVTLSILPNLRYSRQISESAAGRGYEVILHLPMQSKRKDVKEEKGTLKPGESEKDVKEQLAKDISSIPGLKGVSNHMGSGATEDKVLMTEVLQYLKKENLYFFDSLTSEKSVCKETAESVGIRFAKRDLFLDNSNDVDKIMAEINDLKKLALKRGHAIAICHDRKNTMIALAKAMPEMVTEGIEFVSLSEMVK